MQKECIKCMEVRKERKNSIAGWVNYYFTIIIQEDGGVRRRSWSGNEYKNEWGLNAGQEARQLMYRALMS